MALSRRARSLGPNLAELTERSVEKELRIVWHGEDLFRPIVREAGPTRAEAEALADRLRSSR